MAVRVSIIVCSFNGEATIGRALDSALSQSMPASGHEVIVVDDGSTDGTPDLVSSYHQRHPNLRYLRSPQNRGLAMACNLGLDNARGQYFIRLDDDDAFDPTILETMVPLLDGNQTDLVYSDRYEETVSTGDAEYIDMRDCSLFKMTAAGVMMRLDILKELGGYRPLFWEEYDLYLRYAKRSGRAFTHVPSPLYYYVRRPGSLTMTGSGEERRHGWQELKAEWGAKTLLRRGCDPAVLDP